MALLSALSPTRLSAWPAQTPCAARARRQRRRSVCTLDATRIALVVVLPANMDMKPFVNSSCPPGDCHISGFSDATMGHRATQRRSGTTTPIECPSSNGGCYHELGTSATRAICNAHCKGYKYYGVQDGSKCFCSNSYGTTGKKTSDGDCNMPCQGNSSEICGGNSHNSVYARGNCRPL